jgi:hypothetical protein
MMHEIAIWYLLGTGIVVPIVVAYILSVVMRMSKQYDKINGFVGRTINVLAKHEPLLESHDRQIIALTEDYRHVSSDINLLHEVIFEHSRVDSYLTSELERLKPEIKRL